MDASHYPFQFCNDDVGTKHIGKFIGILRLHKHNEHGIYNIIRNN